MWTGLLLLLLLLLRLWLWLLLCWLLLLLLQLLLLCRRRPFSLSFFLPLPFLLPRLVPSAPRHTLVVAVHTVDTLARLREHELVNPVFAYFAFEAVRVIRVFARHDRLVQDRQLAHVATVGTVRAYRRSIRE